jgi:two-component system, cell cycle sensor histidine kinase and response regulator CckA
MTPDPSPIATARIIADALLVLSALGAVLAAQTRRGPVPSHLVAALAGAAAIAGAAHALAPVIGVRAVAMVALAAVLTARAGAALWRALPQPAEDTTPRLLDAALAACRDGVAVVTTDDLTGVQIVYANPAFEHLSGYSHDEAMGLSPSVLVDEVDSLTAIREALRGTEAVRSEVPGRRKDGSRVWAEWQIVPVLDEAGRHTHSVAVLRDITERRRGERALRESEARFRGLFEHAADGIFVLDSTGRIVDANRQACQSLGYTREELTTRRLAEFEVPTGSSLLGSVEADTAERTLCRKDGGTMAAEIRYAASETAGRRLSLALVRDVSRRRSAEQALREREELLRGVISHIPCAVFWKGRDSVYLGCNEQLARDHGLSDPVQIVGRNDYDITRDREEAALSRDCDRKVMDSGRPILHLEEYQTRPDGTRAALLTSKVPLRDAGGRVVGVLGVSTDITDRKRLEEQLRQAQKMEAVGRLAGGVAHDFNNLLTIIRGNAELLHPALDGAGSELLDDLVLASDRATALVRQLLLFSRCQPTRVEGLDLGEVVTALSGLLRRLLGEKVALVFEPAGEPATIRADRAHLEQVVMNLAVNARDAMPTGGVLTIRSDLATGASGKSVRLTVSDSGVGMTEEVKARIFEPFFTTKGPDKGTGLGLATVFGIVQQAGGSIEVESAPGAGATFRVNFPWWSGASSGLTPTPPARRAGRTAHPVSVLLVEDQAGVRKFAGLALRGEGHRVSEAGSGEAALERAGAGEPFDVLVTDLMMPGIDGRELAERIRLLRPEVGVVLMSGYAPVWEGGETIERSVFLQKPFPPGALLAALNQALQVVGRRSESVVGCSSPA